MKFNPDNIKLETQKTVLESDSKLKTLYERTNKQLKAYRPDINEFTEIYPDTQDDIVYVREKQEQFIESLKKDIEEDPEKAEFLKKEHMVSSIAEGIITDQLSGSWLNSTKPDAPYRVVCHPTSEFDDYRNGADMVVESFNNIKQEASHLGLSIDLTLSNNQKNLEKKIDLIFDEMQHKDWDDPYVKYFESDFSDHKGRVDIARCVVVVSRETLSDLMEKKYYRKRDNLDQHPFQISLIHQIEKQAETFSALAKRYGNEKIADMYQEILANIAFLKKEKNDDFSEITESTDALKEKYRGLELLNSVLLRRL